MTNVLVVDDTKNIRMLLTKCLGLENCTVAAAESGREALDILQKRTFDLVFLDVRMPEISGTEVLKKIREKEINTPVIMMTAFGTVKNAVECTQLGAVAYMQKPFTENKVHQTMQAVLQNIQSREESLLELLKMASKQIVCEQLDETEALLKNNLSRFFMEPAIYRMLAEIYEKKGVSDQARKCMAIANSILE